MEPTKKVDDLPDRLAKAKTNAAYLCERAQAVIDQATALLHRSSLRLRDAHALLQHASQSTSPPRSSSPSPRH
jgi:hypothetical protein